MGQRLLPKIKPLLMVSAALTLMLAGCAQSAPEPIQEQANTATSATEKIQVVTTFTILADMVTEIGGDRVEVHNLVPTGTDPHEYEPLPGDLRATADADLIFLNGLNLEGGDDGWFARLTQSVGQEESRIIEVSQEVKPLYLGEAGGEDDSRKEEINPHSFTDPNNGILMAEAILAALQEADPDHSSEYSESAEAYITQLIELENEYAEQIQAIPKEQRILVTSERAFQYLADRYEITEAFLWEIDTDENGSAEQITTLVNFLRSNDVAHLVIESNVDARPMQTVSQESGVPIYEQAIFSDEIGDANNPDANTYLKYLSHNIEVITGALSR